MKWEYVEPNSRRFSVPGIAKITIEDYGNNRWFWRSQTWDGEPLSDQQRAFSPIDNCKV